MSVPDKLIHAIELQTQGQIDSAVRVFNEVLALDASNAHALYSLSLIALNAGDG